MHLRASSNHLPEFVIGQGSVEPRQPSLCQLEVFVGCEVMACLPVLQQVPVKQSNVFLAEPLLAILDVLGFDFLVICNDEGD